jgi:tRNA(fMet)-specific endonuclease VapC
MTLLDTDIFTLYLVGHSEIVRRVQSSREQLGVTIITWIEVLRGRFEAMLKAATGEELLRAQTRLEQSLQDLRGVLIVSLDRAAAAEFDRLRQHRKVKKMGHADLLIASITLARGATLITRNVRHFRPVPGLRVENWAG